MVEPRGVCSEARPDLCVVDLHPDGKEILLDFTTADASSKKNLLSGSWKIINKANSSAAASKVQKYDGKYDTDKYCFQALPCETNGRWSPQLHSFFNTVKRRCMESRPDSTLRHSAFVAYWRKVLSVSFKYSSVVHAETKLDSLLLGSRAAA